jgi:hypothetical protein
LCFSIYKNFPRSKLLKRAKLRTRHICLNFEAHEFHGKIIFIRVNSWQIHAFQTTEDRVGTRKLYKVKMLPGVLQLPGTGATHWSLLEGTNQRVQSMN